ncbi:MAG TPA: hypothetical protein DHV65_03030, partial [Ktedonobacter sp.]|nr:hypothetical protein [Ktedonobacter sp.]
MTFRVASRLAQPQRDMGRLHRLLHYGDQLFAQACQVGLRTQCHAKCVDDPLGIILAAIEAPIDEALDARAQGLESVSYTHLPLPTVLLVKISAVAVS